MPTKTATPAPSATPSRRQSLLGVGADFDALDALLAECGGDVTDPATDAAVTAWMEENLANAGTKVDAYAMVVADMEARAEAKRREAARLAEQARFEENNAGRLRERLREFMVRHNLEELKGPLHKAKLAAASDKKKLLIDSEAALPPSFLIPTYKPNRDAIEAALAAGTAVPGCRLEPVARSLRLT